MSLRKVLLFLLLTTALPLCAESIDSVFARVPQRVLPILPLSARLDMLDLYNYQMTAQGENRYGGNSLLLAKTEHHLVVQLTEASRWELLRTGVGTDSVRYACIYSVTRPDSMSRLTLYNKEWEEVPSAGWPTYQLTDFITSTDSLSSALSNSASADLSAALRSKLPTLPVYMTWEETESTHPYLHLQLSTASLSQEEQKVLRPLLKQISVKFRY